MRRSVATLLLPMVAALAACGPTLESGTRATRQALAQFRVPVEQVRLANGLRVVVTVDRDLDRVYAGTWYGAGLRGPDLVPTPKGLVAARMLTLPADPHPPTVESDLTGFFDTAPPSRLRALMEREARRMALLETFDAERFRAARQQVADHPIPSASAVNLPWRQLQELSGVDAPPTFGEAVSELTADRMRAWLADWYTPANATVVVVGPAPPRRAVSLARELFGDFDAGRRPAHAAPRLPDQLREQRHLGERGDTTGAVTLAYRMPERHTDAWYAMALLAAVVRNDLREADGELRVDTGIHLLGAPFTGRSPAFWYVRVQTAPPVATGSLVERIQATIERLRTRPIAHSRLESAIESARRTLYPINAGLGAEGRAKLLAAFTLLDDDPNRINELDRRFRNVTPQSILGAAQRYLRPTNCTILPGEPDPGPVTGAENRLSIR